MVAEDLPLSPSLRAGAGGRALQYALHGGEDYELLFTVPANRQAALQAAALASGTACSVIGVCQAAPELWLQHEGVRQSVLAPGFDHFTLHR